MMSKEEKALNVRSEKFLNDLWQYQPGFAISVGQHDFDHLLVVPSEENLSKENEFFKQSLRDFQSYDVNRLSPSAVTDLGLLLNFIETQIWHFEKFQSHQWDPSVYNVGGSLGHVLEGVEKSEEEKLRAILIKLTQLPAYYKAAKKNVLRPTKPHTELAIKQNKGLSSFFKSIGERAEKSQLTTEEKTLFKERLKEGQQAVSRYVHWLEKVLKNPRLAGGFRDFRIGSERYDEKFELDLQSSYSARQIYHRALQEKREVLKKMVPLAQGLWPKYMGQKKRPKDDMKMIKRVIEKVSEKHATAEEFVSTIRAQIPVLTEFVRAKELISLDEDKPLKVRETPEYQRGFAGASIDAPGPFEKKRETFYNVTPLDGMSKKDQLSYLREYNHYTLQILNIHEAIPGHYLQLVYANRTPSLVKSLFGNGTMIEGWAVYGERVMLEEGYGSGSPELWLMYYKWFLRVVTNTIIDYEIHNKKLSRNKALRYMIDEAFQERAEAEKKWVRATLSQVQLASYYAGFTEIFLFREAQKKRLGKKFDLKDFHEEFLSYGSASIKAIKGLMTETL